MSLEAKQLTFGYRRKGKEPVLDRIDLTLEPGERLGLLGPSGRGARRPYVNFWRAMRGRTVARCWWTASL